MKFISALLLVLLTSCIDRGKGHAVGSARIELAQIQGSIEMCAIERPVQLREIFEQGEAGFLNRYYQFASGTDDSLVRGNPNWERAHTYIDPWGNPYKIKIT